MIQFSFRRRVCVCARVCVGVITLTWWGSNPKVAAEVFLQHDQHSGHVLLHLVQADDVLHQGGVDAHFCRLVLRFCFTERWCGGGGEEERREDERGFKAILQISDVEMKGVACMLVDHQCHYIWKQDKSERNSPSSHMATPLNLSKHYNWRAEIFSQNKGSSPSSPSQTALWNAPHGETSDAGTTLTFAFLRSVMAAGTKWRDDNMGAEMLSERRHSHAAYNGASDVAEQRTQEA